MSKRIAWDEYFMELAEVARKRSSCARRQVGAVIVVQKNVVSTGYNGTPFGAPNCDMGGCLRCNNPDVQSFKDYGACSCVHAEANAIAIAAKRGIAVNRGVMYVTLKPCFDCMKLIIQAGIEEVFYREDWNYPEPAMRDAYWNLIQLSPVFAWALPAPVEA